MRKVRTLKKLICLIICASFFHVPYAGATVECSVAVSPYDILTQAFKLDPDKKRDQKIISRIERLNFEKEFSAEDIASLVRKLRIQIYGSPTDLKQIIPGLRASASDILRQYVLEETAREGLIEFFNRYEGLNEKDRLSTRVARLQRTDAYALVTWALSVPGWFATVPFFRLPEFAMLQPSRDELSVLIVEGTDSPSSKAIIQNWLPKISGQQRQAILVRSLNVMATVMSISLLVWMKKKERDTRASANGDKVRAKLNDQMNLLDDNVDRITNDTKADILYDVMVRKIKEKNGIVTDDDHKGICGVTDAPHRCQ